MTSGEENTKRWRFRLWHLFAAVALVAVSVFLFQHVSICVVMEPPGVDNDERLIWLRVAWDDTDIINWSNQILEDLGMDKDSPRTTFGF
jgi:hypothetical protein